MHVWHHDVEVHGRGGQNFGQVLSVWRHRHLRRQSLARLPLHRHGADSGDQRQPRRSGSARDLRPRSTAIPYSRIVEGQELTFYQVEAEGDLPVEFMDVETRSRWDMLGYAVSGPLGGVRLEQLPAYNSMWFAWNTYWPETTIWETGDGIIEAPPMTAVLEPAGASLPDGFELTQNYPNPFNPETRIHVTLPVDGQMTL